MQGVECKIAFSAPREGAPVAPARRLASPDRPLVGAEGGGYSAEPARSRNSWRPRCVSGAAPGLAPICITW